VRVSSLFRSLSFACLVVSDCSVGFVRLVVPWFVCVVFCGSCYLLFGCVCVVAWPFVCFILVWGANLYREPRGDNSTR